MWKILMLKLNLKERLMFLYQRKQEIMGHYMPTYFFIMLEFCLRMMANEYIS